MNSRPVPLRERLDRLIEATADLPWQRAVPLAKRTTFGIGGPADLLVELTEAKQLPGLLAALEDSGAPWLVLGGGSNVLIADAGVRGVVVTLTGALARIDIEEEGHVIRVGAGAGFPKLTRAALDLGWPSAVGWMGTPGQVGGALIMNAGTRDGELGDVVHEVRIANRSELLRISKHNCGFSYRKSSFPPNSVLTDAILRCDDRKIEEVKALDAHAKALLKKRHQSQPKKRSAGSIFKNPPGDHAGRLIEQAGLKGTERGGAQISDVHANFIVNLGGATAADVLALAELAAREVKARFDVELVWEVKRIGDFDAGDPRGRAGEGV